MKLASQLLLFCLTIVIPLKAQQLSCIDFDNLDLNSRFGRSNGNEPGDVIIEQENVVVSLEEFLYLNGQTDFIDVTVIDESSSIINPIGQGNLLFVSNINLKLDFKRFERPIEYVCLDIWDGGGEENLSINGQELSVWDFASQQPEGIIAPGVTATFTPLGDRTNNIFAGTLCLSGKIDEIIIGGQEFIIDNLCFAPQTPTTCSIRNFKVTPQPCTPNNVFYADFNFDIDQIAGLEEGYNILLNGELIGEFKYEQDFTTVGPIESNGEEELFFEIVDRTFPDCRDTFNLGRYSCNTNCTIANLKASIVDCNTDGTYQVTVNFDIPATSPPNSSTFTLNVNGERRGEFSYADLPLFLESVGIISGTPGIKIEVCENNSAISNCCLTAELGVPACYPGTCVEFEAFEPKIFSEETGYEAGSTIFEGEDGMVVRLAEFQDLDWFTQFRTLTIKDKDNADFFTSAEGQFMAFEDIAAVFNFSTLEPPAEQITFDFAHEFGAINIAVNGGQRFILNELPAGELALSPSVTLYVEYDDTTLSGVGRATIKGTVYSLFIGGAQFNIDHLCINQPEVCQISEVRVAASNCDANGQFTIKLEAKYENTSGKFALWLNDNETGQVYAYSDLPLELGPFFGPTTQPLKFELVDVEDRSCRGSAVLDPVDCTPRCEISDLLVSNINCQDEDGLYSLELDFKYVGTGDRFQVKTRSGFTETYAYADLPITIKGLPIPDIGADALTVCDASANDPVSPDEPSCCNEIDYKIDCATPPCSIMEVVATAQPCNDDGTFNMVVDLKYEGNVGQNFDLFINDEHYGTFSYEGLPINLGPFDSAPGEVFKIKVIDEKETCYNYVAIEAPNCNPNNCIIQNVRAKATDCDATGQFYALLSFDVINPNTLGFYVFVDGQIKGPFRYDNTNDLEFGPFAGDGSTVYDFLILDIDDPRCFGYAELGPVDCEQDECQIRDLVVRPEGCTDDGYYTAVIDFKVENPENEFFDLYNGNGDLIGYYPIRDLPIQVKLPVPIGQVRDEVVVCINDNPDCCEKIAFEVPGCSDCRIAVNVAEPHPCDNGTFLVDLEVKSNREDDQEFMVVYQDIAFGPFKYGEPFVTVGPFTPQPNEVITLEVMDLTDANCKTKVEIPPYVCNCPIGGVIVEPIECVAAGYYSLKLDFIVSINEAFEFEVLSEDGELIGKYKSSQLPIKIDKFRSSGQNVDRLVVCVPNIADCCQKAEWEALDCREGCGISDLEVSPGVCNDDGSYPLKVNFKLDTDAPQKFEVFIRDGVSLGVFSTEDLPIAFDSFKPSGLEYDYIKVCLLENDQDGCCQAIEWESPDCGGACRIGLEWIEYQPCEGDQYYVHVKVKVQNPVSGGFWVAADGSGIGEFRYSEPFVVLGPFPLYTFKPIELTFTDLESDVCQFKFELEPTQCGDCQIRDLKVDPDCMCRRRIL